MGGGGAHRGMKQGSPWPEHGVAPLVGGCSQPAAERSSLGDRAPGCYGLRTLCLFSWDVHTRLL